MEIKSFKKEFALICSECAEKELMIYDAGLGIRKYSYSEVSDLCNKLGTLFTEEGLVAGDTVVTILPNSPEAIICFLTSVLLGINYAPLPCSVSKRELDNWIDLVNPKLVVKKEDIANFETSVKTISCTCDGDLSWLQEKTTVNYSEKVSRVYLMTSGTTGDPKAMAINTDKLWTSAIAFSDKYDMKNLSVRFWNYLPMSYLGGLFNLAMIPICCKGSFVISEPFSGKTVLNFWNYVDKHKINALWFVPSITQGLLKIANLVGKEKYSKCGIAIKIALLGTAPISLSQKEMFESTFGIRLYENFALSETTFLTAENDYNIRFRENGSVGEALDYVTIKYKDVIGAEGAYNIWVKTPFLFDGYMQRNGSVEIDVDEEGFFNTKDLGRLNEDGIIVLQGRDRDIIKKGGLFVSLSEIEAIIKDLKEVEDCVAVPCDHEFYGESYYLCIICSDKANEDKTVEDVHMWMVDNLVSYKMPDRIITFDKFPKTTSGKIKKNDVLMMIKGDKR